MADITFPSNPTNGQEYLSQSGFVYVWNSSKGVWNKKGNFVRPPKVLTVSGYSPNTSGIITQSVTAAVTVGVDSYKAYTTADSFPSYTEYQFSTTSGFNTISYASTTTALSITLTGGEIPSGSDIWVRARQFVGSSAASAPVGGISTYSRQPIKFTTASTALFTPTIVSIAATTSFPVYNIGFAGTTLPATATYTGAGSPGNLRQVDWRVTGPRIPSSTGDTALAEVGVGTFSSVTLANALVLAMPFSGATGVGITNDVNNAIRTASGASAGTTKTVTANGGIGTATVAGLALTSHFYPCAASGDGTDDYLTVAATADLQFGAGDFTIEFWWYPNGTGRQALYHGSFGTDWSIGIDYSSVGTNKMGIWASSNGTSWNMINADAAGNGICNTTVPQKQWNHVAYVRKGNIFNLYLNGLLDLSVSASGTIVDRSSSSAAIGCWFSTAAMGEFTGYLQDLKVYKGLAKYTENFTPPLPTYGTISYTTGIQYVGVATTAFYKSTGDVGIAETSSTAANALVLAMPMNRTFGFQDINVAIRGLTSGASAGTAKTVGLGTTSAVDSLSSPFIHEYQSKWYNGSAYFDGVNDYAATNSSSSDFTMGSGSYTIEFFMNPSSISGNASLINLVVSDGGNPGINIYRTGSSITVDNGATGSTGPSGGSLVANTWQHIAVVSNGTTTNLYVNGIQVSSYVGVTGSSYSPLFAKIGLVGAGSGSVPYYNGYLQDLKIYKGFAKYTANFTPPQPICGFTTDISTQTGFTTTSATGSLLSSVVSLGSTSTLAFNSSLDFVGLTSITSSSGITTLPDPYAQNLVLALPLANITGVGNSFTNDRNTQIRSVSITGAGVTAGTTKTITNTGVTTASLGSSSLYYSSTAQFGSGRVLTASSSSDFNFGAGDFTIEYWLHRTSLGNNDAAFTNFSQVSSGYLICLHAGTGFNDATLYLNGSMVVQGGTPQANVWNHYAYVRASGNCRIYKNGILIASATSSATAGATNVMNIGAYSDGSSPVTGYMQDVRVYNFAKYTTNFTPPPPMFGDYVRSTNKVIFTPGSDYGLEVKNTSTNNYTTAYSSIRQFATVVSNLKYQRNIDLSSSLGTVTINNSFPQTSMGNLVSDGTYLYSAYAPSTSYIYRTSDLSTWTQVATTSGSYRGGLFYDNGVFFNFSGSNDAGINRSTDGVNWTAISIPDYGGSSTFYAKYNSARKEFVFGGGSWVSANVFRKSTDNGLTVRTTRAISSAYGNNGMMIETSNDYGPTAYMTVNISNGNSTATTYDISVSDDGETWTTTDWTKFGTTPSVRGLYYINGYYYAFNGTIFARLVLGSTTFSRVYPTNIPTTINGYGKFTLNGVEYAYLSGDGVYSLSTDGINWYRKTHAYTTKTLYNFMVHKGVVYAHDGADFYSIT